MTAPNEVYVDPSIAADSGAGSSGSPYGDLEWALEQTTPNANGDRFNIKAGTDEVLEFALDITTDYGTPTETAPIIFQGYTTTAGDGGIGGISGNGSVSIHDDSATDYIYFIDMHMHSTGSAVIMTLDRNCGLTRCEIDNSTNTGAVIFLDIYSHVAGCHFHNIAGSVTVNGFAGFNLFENGTNDFTTALVMGSANFGGTAYRNILDVDGNTDGISLGATAQAINNSIYSNGGTGWGIRHDSNANATVALNNLIEGFSDTGGIGILKGSGCTPFLQAGNSVYNCTTEYSDAADFTYDDWTKGGAATDEILSASPFTNASTNDFSPVNTGAVKEGSLPDDFGNGAI